MKPKKITILIIAVSLAFAGAIIASSYLLADTGYSQIATFVLIAIWWIPFVYLINLSRKNG